MPDTDMDTDGADEQDQAETFDETHLDDEGDGDLLLDEVDDVLDVTQADGDADEDEFDEDDIDTDETQGRSGLEEEADALLGEGGETPESLGIDDDEESESAGSEGEVELVYAGLMENTRGAQASAAHWESKTLSDDDIAELGYDPEPDNEDEETA